MCCFKITLVKIQRAGRKFGGIRLCFAFGGAEFRNVLRPFKTACSQAALHVAVSREGNRLPNVAPATLLGAKLGARGECNLGGGLFKGWGSPASSLGRFY